MVGAGGVCRGDYPTHGAHEGRPYKGLSRAWWEPNVGQAHALQVWPRSVDVTRTSYSRTNRPCRVVPAHQGMKIGCIGWWKGQVSPGPRTPPLAGDKPQRYISLATLGCRCSGDGSWCRRPAPEFIPDRSPGHAFVPMTLTKLAHLSLNGYVWRAIRALQEQTEYN